jgi:tetratricopeptide (TPR) repeat protein
VTLNHFGSLRPFRELRPKLLRYVRLCEKEILDQPFEALNHIHMANHLRGLGRLDEALEYCHRARTQNRHLLEGWVSTGHVFRAVGDLRGAREAYLEAVIRYPEGGSLWSNAALWNLVGVMDLELGRLDDAAKCFERARSGDPLLSHILINLGLLAEARKNFSGAAVLYRSAAKENAAFLLGSTDVPSKNSVSLASCCDTPSPFTGLRHQLRRCEARNRPALKSNESEEEV